jgi:predicted molibdopterin-dependent oxidoreductase YjgC
VPGAPRPQASRAGRSSWTRPNDTTCGFEFITELRRQPRVVPDFRIENGERAIIRSPVGHLEVEILVDARVGRGMVIMPVGTWIKRGAGANVLTEDIMSNFGQMAAFGETRVRLERLGTA